ncbi:hypothetical protein [Clostridium sp. 'White wine YQ']|uniref:hypothetical protein n=1 Tax=Clostridium sp. 'White wine YQ' TaxID=3027474 RepID=UPI002366711B|nr:hypothetical protein [Clostridium sp. 'White wine YQ']MDD7794697.1 hypothetical protein [Clostridium sp. 'White wine YQ']
MSRVFKIIKVHWNLLDVMYKFLTIFYIIILTMMAQLDYRVIKEDIEYYINTNKYVNFSSTISQSLSLMMYCIIFYTFFIRRDPIVKKYRKYYNRDFFVQLPILKKDLLKGKFLLYIVASIPALFVIITFITLNIYYGQTNVVSAYSGLLVLLFFLWFLAASISNLFEEIYTGRFSIFKFLDMAFILIINFYIIYSFTSKLIDFGTIANDAIMYNSLGEQLAPVLKMCRYIGGAWGIPTIIIAIILSYFISCKLPIFILGKKEKVK